LGWEGAESGPQGGWLNPSPEQIPLLAGWRCGFFWRQRVKVLRFGNWPSLEVGKSVAVTGRERRKGSARQNLKQEFKAHRDHFSKFNFVFIGNDIKTDWYSLVPRPVTN